MTGRAATSACTSLMIHNWLDLELGSFIAEGGEGDQDATHDLAGIPQWFFVVRAGVVFVKEISGVYLNFGDAS